MLLGKLGACHERRNLLLFLHLPIDVGFNIWMVRVYHHHFSGAAGRAARFDSPGGAVTDLEEAHEAGRATAAGKRLAFAAQLGKVRARSRTVFEQTRFTHPKVHNAAFVHEVVFHALNEASMGLGMLVGGFGLRQFARLEVNIVVALAWAINAVGPMQTCVKPLWGVWRDHLIGQHEAKLIIESLRIGIVVEVAALPTPIGPGSGQTVEHLFGGCFTNDPLFLRQALKGQFIGH